MPMVKFNPTTTQPTLFKKKNHPISFVDGSMGFTSDDEIELNSGGSHKSYKNQKVKDEDGDDVTSEVDCMSIQDTDDIENEKNTTGTSSQRKMKKWTLEEKIKLKRAVENYSKKLSRIALNLQNENSTENSSKLIPLKPPPSSSNVSPTPSRKKKSHHRKETPHDLKESFEAIATEESDDELELFFKSMAKTVRKLPKVYQLKAKRKVFEVVSELENKALLPQS